MTDSQLIPFIKNYSFLFSLAVTSPEYGVKCRSCEAIGAYMYVQFKIVFAFLHDRGMYTIVSRETFLYCL